MEGGANSAGLEAESVAADWLKAQGFKLLEARVACRYGEIDLVMRNRSHLLLVEVKYRTSDLAAAIDSVTIAKQKKLSLAARWLYSQRPGWQSLTWRFDVLALSGNLAKPEVKWLPAAFELT